MSRKKSMKKAGKKQVRLSALFSRPSRDYWRIAGGLAGLAITAFALLSVAGPRLGSRVSSRLGTTLDSTRDAATKLLNVLGWNGSAHPVSGASIDEQTGADAARAH